MKSLWLPLLALAVLFSACSKERRSKKSLEIELQALKAKSAEETEHIRELEEQLRVQTELEKMEEEQERVRADIEARNHIVPETLEPPAKKEPSPLADVPTLTPVPVTTTPPDSNQGFSFTAVRSIPSTPSPASPPIPAPIPVASPGPAVVSPPKKPPNPRAEHLAAMRQELRNEINRVFTQIKARRATRYGEKEGQETGDTYIELKSYNPETGRNKRGGKKPKLAVDLDTGLNQEYPEDSICLDNLSLSATFLRARLLRDEIIEYKNQNGLK